MLALNNEIVLKSDQRPHHGFRVEKQPYKGLPELIWTLKIHDIKIKGKKRMLRRDTYWVFLSGRGS